ncbi:allophanate hydrolase [Pseudoclavibacter endophyticus]|uniref:5-oxoprolinase subunit B/C family protein n=1 Tax=Pseudoclavibacter endophyticus TaxID=1778590 RepID=UPI0016698F14|nr:carboxyltransferase domain-containing protein [Pseudoclavibacter endophyticus]GGA73814.1 allophanate hydrolase [Pseudoclavibacter endophyticus]
MTAKTSDGPDGPRLLPVGSEALIVESPSLAAAMALRARIAADPPRGLTELLPAARTVLCRFATGLDATAARARIAALVGTEAAPARRVDEGDAARSFGTVEIGVVYDGDDLDAVAAALGMSRSAVVAAHTGSPWTSAFIGFAPGFAYLAGGDDRLTLPRRATPRTTVPAGSVAIAGGFSAVYPGASPGGWHLLGRTDAELWRPEREPPALLPPGTRVRFRPVRELVRGAAPPDTAGAERQPASAAGVPALRVDRPGGLALVEDLGRPGYAGVGVPASGAADRESLRRANRLVGNPAGAAAIELAGTGASGGFRATAVRDTIVAVTGAPCRVTITRAPTHRSLARGESPRVADLARADWGRWADWTPAGDELPPCAEPVGDADAPRIVDAASGAPLLLHAGDAIAVDLDVDGGAWSAVLGVRGGIAAPVVLGSRSRDLLSGLGPLPVTGGDELCVPAAARVHAAVGTAEPDPPLPPATVNEPAPLTLQPGPRLDRLTPHSRMRLTELVWRIRPDSNRIGVRLEPADPDLVTDDGPPLEHVADAELASEGVVPGAVQVPPGGGPVVFGRDHPVTGGYPVVGVISPASLDVLARLAPGRCVRLVSQSPGDHLDVIGAW